MSPALALQGSLGGPEELREQAAVFLGQALAEGRCYEPDSGRSLFRFQTAGGRICVPRGAAGGRSARCGGPQESRRKAGLSRTRFRCDSDLGQSVRPKSGLIEAAEHEGGGIIIICTAAEFEDTRARWIAETWSQRLPAGWALRFISDVAPQTPSQNASLHGHAASRLAPPAYWRFPGAAGGYQSHLYKFFLGLRGVLLEEPPRAWYGLIDDDSFVDADELRVALADALGEGDPNCEALCVGPDHEEGGNDPFPEPDFTHAWMMRQCHEWSTEYFGKSGKQLPGLHRSCMASTLGRLSWGPARDRMQVHGAGIFCTRAAVLRLLPHLQADMTRGLARLFTPMFPLAMPPWDTVLNACMEDLGIAKAALPFHGHGAPWHPSFLKSGRNLSGRPPLWHRVRSERDFHLLDFFHGRFAPRGSAA